MVAAVRVHKPGGPEVLTYEEVSVPATGTGQIKVRNHAVGVNYIDTYFRTGMLPRSCSAWMMLPGVMRCC